MPDTQIRASMTIGAFSRLCRLSVKALRLYDSLSLLPPALIDEASGYRYYTSTQLERARQISLLRQLNLPLPTIAELLDAPDGERGVLLRQLWQGIEAAHSQRRNLVEYLLTQVFADHRSINMTQTMTQTQQPQTAFNVQQRFVPQQQVLSLMRRVLVQDLPQLFEDSAAMKPFIEQQGAQVSGPMFAIYHGQVNADSDGPVEICFPYSGELKAQGEYTLRQESAHHEAYVTLTKAQFVFPQILSGYDAAQAHATQIGECGQMSPREVYTYPWNEAGPADPAGEVAWPFVPRST